jgi:hypothetical protein
MNTRSRARAEQEVRRSIEKHRRIDRKERFAPRNNVVTPYKLRSTMGRKGDKSTKATHSRSKRYVESLEKAEVAPIRLFSLGEEDTFVENEEIQVCSGYIKFRLNIFKSYESQILKICCRIITNLESNLNFVPGRGKNNEEARQVLQKTLVSTSLTLIAKRKVRVEKKPKWRRMASTPQKRSTR